MLSEPVDFVRRACRNDQVLCILQNCSGLQLQRRREKETHTHTHTHARTHIWSPNEGMCRISILRLGRLNMCASLFEAFHLLGWVGGACFGFWFAELAPKLPRPILHSPQPPPHLSRYTPWRRALRGEAAAPGPRWAGRQLQRGQPAASEPAMTQRGR